MATEEHKECATFIKCVHSSLRKLSQEIGYEKAWIQHCSDEENLKLYAKAMTELGSKYWEVNAADSTKAASSRITWVTEYCREYFYQGEKINRRRKELLAAERMGLTLETDTVDSASTAKIRVIDVGSCYNPFGSYDYMHVLPVDLAPATPDVYQCDFLNVTLADEDILVDQKVERLYQCSYDVVIFCLLLEYLPSSEQREVCCKKAFSLLKPEGILIIVSPDSKHVGANAKLIKNWRYALALMGFSRIKYEKLSYLHCMVFRKALHLDLCLKWASLHKESYMSSMISIPQDFNYIVNCKNAPILYDEVETVNLFRQLP